PRAPEVLLAELHTTMRTAVLDDMDRVVVIAHDDDGSLAHPGALEIARQGDLGFESHVAPVTAVEEALELAPVERIVRVDLVWHAARAWCAPAEIRDNVSIRNTHHATSTKGSDAPMRTLISPTPSMPPWSTSPGT